MYCIGIELDELLFDEYANRVVLLNGNDTERLNVFSGRRVHCDSDGQICRWIFDSLRSFLRGTRSILVLW